MTAPEPTDFTACEWWWPDGLEPAPDQYADFAADIHLPSVAEQAQLSITCGSWYTLWINSEWILHGPAREVAPWQYYDTVDLRPYVKPGINRLRIRAYHLGVATQFHEPCLAGLMLCGTVTGAGWSVCLHERNLWRAARSSGFLPGAPRLHACNIFGEHIDLSADPQEWLKADFQTSCHAVAERRRMEKPPAVVALHPLPGREKLIPNDLPPFCGEVRTARFRGVSKGWNVYEFETEVFGFLSADVESGLPRTCELIHGESLTGQGLPDYQFGGGDFREILELPAGRRQWESFEKRAMRYIALPESVQIHRLSVREYRRPLEEVWKKTPQAAALSRRDHAIVSAAARTVMICCDDLLNDCPRRERAQYNDPAVYMEAFPLLFGTWEPVRRWLRQFLRGAGPDGVLRACYPSPATNRLVIPDFSLLFASNVRRYLEATGDLETARACFPAALAGVEAFERFADSDGLLTDVPGWVFLCNSFELAKQPRSSGLNAIWAAAWKHLGFLARRLGDDRADLFEEKSVRLRAAWRGCFLRDGLVLDSDSSPEHQKLAWWNYHYEADRGFFADRPQSGSFLLRVPWKGSPRRLQVAAPGFIRVWCNGVLILQETAKNPWVNPHPFHPWTCEIPDGFCNGEFLIEAGYNGIDWEVLLSADDGTPAPAAVGEIPVSGEGDFPFLNVEHLTIQTPQPTPAGGHPSEGGELLKSPPREGCRDGGAGFSPESPPREGCRDGGAGFSPESPPREGCRDGGAGFSPESPPQEGCRDGGAGFSTRCETTSQSLSALVGARPAELRPWFAPRFNQITAGYAVDSGMLEPEEAVAVLRACLREQYHVPWLKRTTPLICTPTSDAGLISGRAVLCNTPHSLFFFCRALESHGMRDEARELCRRLFGAMPDAGSSTLWEEFAPRSSLCHAWGAMCVPYFLSPEITK